MILQNAYLPKDSCPWPTVESQTVDQVTILKNIVEWQIYYTNSLPCQMGVLLNKASYCLQLFGLLHVHTTEKKGLATLVLPNYQWTSTKLLDRFGFLVICVLNCTNLQILFRSVKKGIISQIWFQPIVQHILCIFALIF